MEPANRLYRLRLARYKALAEAIAAFIHARPDHERTLDLLDVGPGSGRSLSFLDAEGVGDRIRFHGLELSEDRISSLCQRARWDLVQADAAQGLPYDNNRFDICICEQILEHLANPADVISEVQRVLRPGGLAIFGVPTFPPGIASLRALGAWIMSRFFGAPQSHVQTFTCRSFCTLIRREHGLALSGRRGFRILSGGLFAPLEDYHWWYALNRRIGQALPSLCTEIQVLCRKSGPDRSLLGRT